MKEILIGKLLEYIRDNNPDILFALEAEDKLRSWLYDKAYSAESLVQQLKNDKQPDYIIQETCLVEMTRDLRPSRYNYILNILEQEFERDYELLLQSGLLQHEIVNMIDYCNSTFDDLRFAEENEDSQFIRYAITGAVSEYLESNRVDETVSNELQQSAET
jgi:predicted DNA-binding transcriptional regulator